MNVVWFKRDLRLADHAPLAAAIERSEPLLLLYIVEPTLLGDPHYRGRHWHFIAQSLQAMNDELAMLGAQIQVLEGEPVSLLNTLHQSQPIGHLYSHEETGLGVTLSEIDRSPRSALRGVSRGTSTKPTVSSGVDATGAAGTGLGSAS